MMGITTAELLREAWAAPDAAERAPGITRHLCFERDKALWLKEQVVACKRDGDRKKLLERYADVAEQCLLINNFSGFMIFVAALREPALACHARLYTKRTAKHLDAFARLTADGCKELCSMQERCAGQCLPYLEPWLSSLTAIERGNMDFVPGSARLINWRKVQMLGAALCQPQAFLRFTGYSYSPKPPVIAFIHSMKPAMAEADIARAAAAIQAK